jgi:glucose-1-phosphate thymidylyltransferase
MNIVITDIFREDSLLYWLTLYRPASEFRIGGFSLRERLEKIVGKESVYYMLEDPRQASYIEKRVGLASQELPDNNFLIINSRLIASFNELENIIKFMEKRPVGSAVYKDTTLLIGKLNKDHIMESQNVTKEIKHIDYPTANIFIYKHPWEFIKIQPIIISDDVFSKYIKNNFNILKPSRGDWPTLISKDGLFIEKFVYLDTSKGPIIMCDNVEVNAFSRIMGPSVIRENSIILSSLIRDNVAIGPTCKIGGEIASSIIDGYSNMAHQSYLGHSFVGEWVNIGAFTVTSDLKNTYGPIKVDIEGNRVDTGLIKLGSFICDYVKTSISTTIFAGKFIGIFSHVMGLVYDNIPPFTMWNGYTRIGYELDIDSAIKTQERMYNRRGVKQLKEEISYIRFLYEATSQYRENISKERFQI